MANILIIDDDPWVLKVFIQMLETEGHQTIQATNGQDGIKLYKEHLPDLVITDMVMPHKDGLETIMDLNHDFPDVKIIAISGGGVIEPDRYLALAKTIGAVKTMQKPVTKAELIAAVDEALNE
jgi:CheY-like chemotaxis protein